MLGWRHAQGLTREPLKPELAYSSLMVVVGCWERDGSLGVCANEGDPRDFIGSGADQVAVL